MSTTHQASTPVHQQLVTLVGELDISAATELAVAWSGDASTDVVVDLSAVTFMDCSGYRGIVAARLDHEAHGGSLAMRCATGQPEALLRIIEELGHEAA